MSTHTSANVPIAEETWRQIEGLVEEITTLAKADLSTRDFYAELLDRAIRALAAVGGAVWTFDSRKSMQLAYQINLSQVGVNDAEVDLESHRRYLESTLSADGVRAIAPGSGTGENDLADNPTECLLLLGPVDFDGQLVAIVEIFQRCGTSPDAQRGYVELVGLLCEVAADFHRNRRRLDLQQRETLWARFDRFAQTVNSSLDLSRVAFEIANEGRRLVGCDRVSVLESRGHPRGPRCRVLAVSGLETVNRRSNQLSLLEPLSAAMIAIGEPLRYAGQSNQGIAPQVETKLQAYLDHSHARRLDLIPMREHELEQTESRESEPIGALVFEWFGGPDESVEIQQRLEVVCRHSFTAFRNALEIQRLPLAGLLRWMGRIKGRLRGQTLAIAAVAFVLLASGIAALTLTPASMKIEGRGELQPLKRQNVFAPSDGVVSQLHIQRHAEQVSRSDVLLQLIDRQLEYEMTSVLGEKETALQQLLTVSIERQQISPSDREARVRGNQLTAREEELKVLLRGLENQLSVLKKRQQELSVQSSIDGQLLTWDITQLLQSRPVQRGQTLMTLADTEGPWVLEMHVPDKHIGYVLTAQKELGEELEVSFILKTDPGVTYRGVVKKVAMATDSATDPSAEATVLVTVEFDREQISPLRPGATVIAKIHCGQRALGYVWLHDLIETVRTYLLF